MTRYIVAREGVLLPGNRFIEPGTIEVLDETIPVIYGWNMDSIEHVIGRATYFQRDEAGVCTMEIEFRDGVIDWLRSQDDDEYGWYLSGTEAVKTEEHLSTSEEVLVITKGILRSIHHPGISVANPGALINKDG